MRTLVAMISTGDRVHLSSFSFPRASRWASRHGYSVILIKHRLEGHDRLPHYAKLKVAEDFPGFDQYCIVDDDILMSSKAPQLPEVPDGFIGLAADHEQRNTTNVDVEWTGNTGFLVFRPEAVGLLRLAYDRGDDDTVWGIADQGALNAVLWSTKRAFEIDPRWNHMPILFYFMRRGGWDKWSTSRLFRITYYLKLLLLPWGRDRLALRNCYCCHLIRAPYPKLFDKFLH